jgi:hypothetical protein
VNLTAIVIHVRFEPLLKNRQDRLAALDSRVVHSHSMSGRYQVVPNIGESLYFVTTTS